MKTVTRLCFLLTIFSPWNLPALTENVKKNFQHLKHFCWCTIFGAFFCSSLAVVSVTRTDVSRCLFIANSNWVQTKSFAVRAESFFFINICWFEASTQLGMIKSRMRRSSWQHASCECAIYFRSRSFYLTNGRQRFSLWTSWTFWTLSEIKSETKNTK